MGSCTAKIGHNSLDFYAENGPWAEAAEAACRHSFFHWDLEFPDVFYGRDGRPKGNPGFDAVVGNPPYGAKLSEMERQYHKQRYDVGSTDTAQLMIGRGCGLLSKYGFNGFIVPKAFVYASNWIKTREHTLNDLTTVIDCGKVWKDVKLEQIIYIYQNNSKSSTYLTGTRERNNLAAQTKISKKTCEQFGLIVVGIETDELLLGQKILAKSERLGKYITNSRGDMLQKQIKSKGEHKVLGGAQIRRYDMSGGLKGYVDAKDCTTKSRVSQDSILVQRLVAHIQNPTDHIKITATIPRKVDFVIVDTINQIRAKNIDPHYVLGLLNSKVINWYVYRFVFAKTVRTMDFDNPVTSRIPIVVGNEKSIVRQVKKILQHAKQTARSTTVHEDELNRMFYRVFGLSDDEISAIEESTPE